MASSRRSFLAGAAAWIGLAATAPLYAEVTADHSSWSKNASSWVDTTPYEFTPELFEPLVGSKFRVTDATLGGLTMTLTSVELPQAKSGPGTAVKSPPVSGFALHFRQISGVWLPQGTYQLSLPQLGTFPLFIVPGSKVRPTSYTAIINHI
jgi:hypothetical protein